MIECLDVSMCALSIIYNRNALYKCTLLLLLLLTFIFLQQKFAIFVENAHKYAPLKYEIFVFFLNYMTCV